MSNHARLGPSNKRWPYCPGSVREEEPYPDVAGEAAIDGTGSHVLLELCLINDVRANYYDQLIIGLNNDDMPNGWLVDVERCNRVQICLDYVVRRQDELKKLFPGCTVTVQAESKSNPGFFAQRNDWWGTVDITITAIAENSEILFVEAIDYKDGRGYVSEKWNTQLIAYLFGKMIECDGGYNSVVPDIGMRMTIVQPKTGTPIRYQCSTNPDHGLNKETLLSKVQWLIEAAEATDDPNAPLIAGKHCQWCNHNLKRGGACTASTEQNMEVIESMTNEITTLGNDDLLGFIKSAVTDVKSLTPEQLTKIADTQDGFMAVFDKVKTEIQDRIEAGETIPGYAMLPGRVSKVWSEPEDVVAKSLKSKRLKKDQIYPAKLISPAAALKIPGLTEIQISKIKKDLISEVAGKMTLKKVAYDHKAIKDVGAMFPVECDVDADTTPVVKETISFF